MIRCRYCGFVFDETISPVCPHCFHDSWSLSDELNDENNLNPWDDIYHKDVEE